MKASRIFALLTVVTVLFLVGIGWILKGVFLNSELTESFAHEKINSITNALNSGNVSEFYKLETSEEFRRITSLEALRTIDKVVLESLGKATLTQKEKIRIRFSPKGKFWELRYWAQFEKGEGIITASYQKAGEDWKLVSLGVFSNKIDEYLRQLQCPACGKKHSLSDKYCPNCGKPINN